MKASKQDDWNREGGPWYLLNGHNPQALVGILRRMGAEFRRKLADHAVDGGKYDKSRLELALAFAAVDKNSTSQQLTAMDAIRNAINGKTTWAQCWSTLQQLSAAGRTALYRRMHHDELDKLKENIGDAPTRSRPTLEDELTKALAEPEPFLSSAAFWAAYSQVSYDKWKGEEQRNNVWGFIGGELGKDFQGQNTCAARVSYGLNYGGAEVSAGSRHFPNSAKVKFANKAGDNKYYIVGTPALHEHLTTLLGEPNAHLVTEKDVNDLEMGLSGGRCAIFVGAGHSGVVKQGYKDAYILTELPVDAWKLA